MTEPDLDTSLLNLFNDEYKNNQTKLKFRCNKGYEWWATLKSIKEGTWCPDCYHKRKGDISS